MKGFVLSAVTTFALALGTVNAQSSEYFGASLSVGMFGLPLPLIGAHVGFEDLIAPDVALELQLSGLALGTSGEWIAIGILSADIVWAFPADDDTIRPYAGAGPGVAFAGISGAGLEFAPYAGVVAGVSVPVSGIDLFLEGRGNFLISLYDESLWWLSVAVGVEFRP